MITFVISLIGILLTIFFVVSIHEFGHFLFARLLGVKVLRFSIGFGKPLCQWHDSKGTEYSFAPILLGGYVKLLDENESPVCETDSHMAYNRQPIFKRFLIAFAGPLFNLLFALFIYWFLFIVGITNLVPQVDKITPHSIAFDAGMQPRQEIISVNHVATSTWMSVIINILTQAGNKGMMPIEVKQPDTHETKTLNFNLTHWHLDDLKPDPFASLGFLPYEPFIPAIIDKVQPDSDAFSKLTKGDKILSVDKKPVSDWSDLVNIITEHPGETLTFTINHNGKIIQTQITIGYKRDMLLKKYGFLGISPQFTWPESLLRKQQYGPYDSMIHALREVTDLTKLNFIIIGKMLVGKISLKSLGGPITIFESAGSALNHGFISFLGFLAFLSIAIGIINLLPIPGLDGGHVLLQLIEAIRGKPTSLKFQMLFFRLGFIFIILIMVQALMNDFLRM